MILLLAALASAAELSHAELEDTAFTLAHRRLAIHPITQPWQYGLSPWADVRFSVQSIVLPGPELRGRIAPVQTESTALSVELGGELQWSAGLEAALRVAEERIQRVPGVPSTQFTDAMADDVSQQMLLQGTALARASQRIRGPVFMHLTLGYGLGRVDEATVVRAPSVLFVDWQAADRTILRGGARLDMATIDPDRETTWSVDLRWAHAWDRFRVEAGARFVGGALKDATLGLVENTFATELPDVPFIALPSFSCWWRF